jgi:glutamate synthase domain-containing protein 3
MATEPVTGAPTITEPVALSAVGISYRELNAQVRTAIRAGATEITLSGVTGHRYIGTGIHAPGVTIHVNGVPGEDLCAFLDGPTVVVHNNAQDGVGNTMNEGRIEIHGQAGDVVGYGMRGGRILIKGDVGYRVGIHMKGYRDKQPLIVTGGCAGNFFGEYMAGGCQVLLGIGQSETRSAVGRYCATGMHGGVMYVRGELKEWQLGKEVSQFTLDNQDREFLKPILDDYTGTFDQREDFREFDRFVRIAPVSARPYGRLYVY